MVINKKGMFPLSKEYINGTNPLANFGPHAFEKIKKTHECKYVADIMINSFYDDKIDEVAAFEEQVGSHGGMGGKQSFPFIFFPKKWYFPHQEILGAEKIHLLLKHWLIDIGQIKKVSSNIYDFESSAFNKQFQ
jgi:putative membrane protein